MNSRTNHPDFKWRHFQDEIILWAVRWYCKYGFSYRDLEEMFYEGGVQVDHTTITVVYSNMHLRLKSVCGGIGNDHPSYLIAGVLMKRMSKSRADGLICIEL